MPRAPIRRCRRHHHRCFAHICISRLRLRIQISLISHVSGGSTRLLLLAEGGAGGVKKRRRRLNTCSAVPTSRGVLRRCLALPIATNKIFSCGKATPCALVDVVHGCLLQIIYTSTHIACSSTLAAHTRAVCLAPSLAFLSRTSTLAPLHQHRKHAPLLPTAAALTLLEFSQS